MGQNGCMSETETLISPEATISERLGEPMLDEGDHERFSHYVRKKKILPSAIEGSPLVALCGKIWVPSRDPKKFPVCPECKKIFEGLRGSGGDDDGSE